MDLYLYGFEVLWMYLDTADKDRPVYPPSVQALENICERISGGQRSIIRHSDRCPLDSDLLAFEL